MSLWTPGGEHQVGREPEPGEEPDIFAGLSEEQRAELENLSPEERERARVLIAQMNEARRQMLETPAAVIVANHAMGLYELAAIHLAAEHPKLAEVKLAIDALAGILEAAGGELGENGQVLQDALSQIQLAFVTAREASGGDGEA